MSKSGSSTYNAKLVNTWQAPVSSNSGLPSIVINIGMDKSKMPVSLEIVGNEFNEGTLISIAYAYEQIYASFISPKLIKEDAFENWTIPQLNNLYALIGKNSYNKILIKESENYMTPLQSQMSIINSFRELSNTSNSIK